MSELHIPDEAYDAAEQASTQTGGNIDDILAAAAPLIVAAELRRLDDEVPKNPSATNVEDIAYESGKHWVTSWIHGRADELDGGTR